MIELSTYHIQTDGSEYACNHVLYCLNSSSGQGFLTVRVEKCAGGRGPEEKMPFSIIYLESSYTTQHNHFYKL